MITYCTLNIPCVVWHPVSELVRLANPILTAITIMAVIWLVIKGVIKRIV